MALPPLTAEAIAPFAVVLRARDGKFTDVPEVLEVGDVPGHHALAILCPQPVDPTNIVITGLERHPHSTQTFIPLTVGRWIVLVAPTLPDGSPDLVNARAVVAGPGDAVCIARNAWHAGLTVLDCTECWIYQHGLRHMGEIELSRGLVGLGGMTS